LVDRGRESPFVALAFAVYVQMGTRDFLVVRVSVRRAVEVQTHEGDGLPRSVLVRGLCDLDPGARDVEDEILALIR